MKKPMALKTALIVCLMGMLLSGCGKGGNANSGFAPIYVSKDDQFTDATARQILQHNETGAELLGWHNNH